jgi:hypothetical protein
MASIYLAVVLMHQGRRHDDAILYLAAADEAIVGRDDEDFVRSWLQNVRVTACLFADDESEEIGQARLDMSLAEVTGKPTSLAMASFALGWALRHRHRDDAIAAFGRSVAWTRGGAGTLSMGVRRVTECCEGSLDPERSSHAEDFARFVAQPAY